MHAPLQAPTHRCRQQRPRLQELKRLHQIRTQLRPGLSFTIRMRPWCRFLRVLRTRATRTRSFVAGKRQPAPECPEESAASAAIEERAEKDQETLQRSRATQTGSVCVLNNSCQEPIQTARFRSGPLKKGHWPVFSPSARRCLTRPSSLVNPPSRPSARAFESSAPCRLARNASNAPTRLPLAQCTSTGPG